jgi:CxxC motif-containing protein (DUF1111 family)
MTTRIPAFLAACVCALLSISSCRRPGPPARPAAHDSSNGLVSDSIHQADRAVFDEVEELADGLGPIYNAQSCRECHQNPTSGGASQITELRVGHLGPRGKFENAVIPINRGRDTITGRTLVNDRAICPNAQFPDSEIQERVPDGEKIRTFRLSLNLLGDGLIEAVADDTLIAIARAQAKDSRGAIHGQTIRVPVLEAPGKTRVARFGWKDQQASLLSFAADAYLNEMGITNRLLPDEVTARCNTVHEPNDTTAADGLADIDRFARFVRATLPPPRDSILAATAESQRGEKLFAQVGCASCHVEKMTTAPAGTVVNGGQFTVPAALGGVTFHPFADFLLHDVGTGDGILMAMPEHYGRNVYGVKWERLFLDSIALTRNKVRTPPLWGVRLRPRLMHDGESLTLRDAILRHGGEARGVVARFRVLVADEQAAILTFLRSL